MEVVGPNNSQDRHNFSICSKDKNGNTTRNGIFVSNCKYGDFFLYLDIHEKYGITNVVPISVYDIKRLEGDNPDDPYELKFIIGEQAREPAENFQVAHFRLLSDSNFLPYGRSAIEGARKTWKKLHLMEDAMLIHRIMRAPERRIFKIDVGNIPPNEVDNFMNKIIANTKKIPYINPSTGDYNLKFNMMNVMEDYFIPTRGGTSGTDIDIAPALQYDAIEDIEYLRDKMLGALRIPRAFLGYEEGIGAKATLAAEDLRFARTIEKIQRIMVSELYKIAIVHLYAQGYKNEDLVDFSLELTSPSVVYEEEKLALWDAKIALASNIRDINMIGSNWIYTEVFKFSEEDIDDTRKNLIEDAYFEYRLSKILDDGEDPLGQQSDSLYDEEEEVEPEEEFAPSEDEEGTEGVGGMEGGEDQEQPEGQPAQQGGVDTSGEIPSGGPAPGGEATVAGESIERKPLIGDKDDKPKKKKRKNVGRDDDNDELGLKDLKKALKVNKSDIKHKYRGGSPLSISDCRKLDA